MKKIIGILGVAMIAATMFFNANALSGSTTDTSLSSLMTLNKAHADNEITDWWNSKIYKCELEECSESYGVIWVRTYNGHYENCQEGNTNAHCYDCKGCDAL